jgi:hypothetical protein
VHQPFRLDSIEPNLFRDLVAYPLHEPTVEMLQASIRSTGFWDNVVARVRPDGRAELAYGHHRVEAARRELGPESDVFLIIRDLDDTTMLRMMAAENKRETNGSAAGARETVRAVVLAYAAGRITLEAPHALARQDQLRHAPGYTMGDVRSDSSAHAYTAETVARFLGWADVRTLRDTLQALEAIEAGYIDEADLSGLSAPVCERVVFGARKVFTFRSCPEDPEVGAPPEQIEEAKAAAREEAKRLADRAREGVRLKAKRAAVEGPLDEATIAEEAADKLLKAVGRYAEKSTVEAIDEAIERLNEVRTRLSSSQSEPRLRLIH